MWIMCCCFQTASGSFSPWPRPIYLCPGMRATWCACQPTQPTSLTASTTATTVEPIPEPRPGSEDGGRLAVDVPAKKF